MSNIKHDFITEAIHTFQIHTLKRFNFHARVTLSNLSNQRSEFATDYFVDLRINFPNGQVERIRNLSTIEIGTRKIIETKSILSHFQNLYGEEEAVLTFSLIPSRYRDKIFIDSSRDELWFLLTAQDHYVEYYTENGFASGLLYQSGAFNYSKFSQERTTIIQAPKIYSDENINTYMSFIHNCFDNSYNEPAYIKFKLITGKGIVKNFQLEIPKLSVKLINFSSLIPEDDFACVYGLCENASLLPLTISHNKSVNTLAVEHSLPPNYYGATITGPNRKTTIEELKKHIFNFEG